MSLNPYYQKLVDRGVMSLPFAESVSARNLRFYEERNSGLAIWEDTPASILESVVHLEQTGGRLQVILPATRCDKENLNKRVYPASVMEKAIANCKEKMRSRRIHGGVYDHPDTPFVAPGHISHAVVDAFIHPFKDTKFFMNKWEVTNTSAGRDLRALVEGLISFGTSIRGFGRTDGPNEDVGTLQDYEFLGTDAVGEPSSQVYADFKAPLTKIVTEALKNSRRPYALQTEVTSSPVTEKPGESETVERDRLFRDEPEAGDAGEPETRNNLESLDRIIRAYTKPPSRISEQALHKALALAFEDFKKEGAVSPTVLSGMLRRLETPMFNLLCARLERAGVFSEQKRMEESREIMARLEKIGAGKFYFNRTDFGRASALAERHYSDGEVFMVRQPMRTENRKSRRVEIVGVVEALEPGGTRWVSIWDEDNKVGIVFDKPVNPDSDYEEAVDFALTAFGEALEKREPEWVQYTPMSRINQQSCGNCRFFRPKGPAHGECSVVKGHIAASGWCVLHIGPLGGNPMPAHMVGISEAADQTQAKVNFKVYSDTDAWADTATHSGLSVKSGPPFRAFAQREGKVFGAVLSARNFKTPPRFMRQVSTVGVISETPFESTEALLNAFESQAADLYAVESTEHAVRGLLPMVMHEMTKRHPGLKITMFGPALKIETHRGTLRVFPSRTTGTPVYSLESLRTRRRTSGVDGSIILPPIYSALIESVDLLIAKELLGDRRLVTR